MAASESLRGTGEASAPRDTGLALSHGHQRPGQSERRWQVLSPDCCRIPLALARHQLPAPVTGPGCLCPSSPASSGLLVNSSLNTFLRKTLTEPVLSAPTQPATMGLEVPSGQLCWRGGMNRGAAEQGMWVWGSRRGSACGWCTQHTPSCGLGQPAPPGHGAPAQHAAGCTGPKGAHEPSGDLPQDTGDYIRLWGPVAPCQPWLQLLLSHRVPPQ